MQDLHKEAQVAMASISDIDKKSEDQIRMEFVQNLFKKKEMVDKYVSENADQLFQDFQNYKKKDDPAFQKMVATLQSQEGNSTKKTMVVSLAQPDSIPPTKEMKDYDDSKAAAKSASIAPVERSQEQLYTPYKNPNGPFSDIPKDWNAMPAYGEESKDKKDDKSGKEKPAELKAKSEPKKDAKKAAPVAKAPAK